MESVVIALIISGLFLFWQQDIDDDRSRRELEAAQTLTQRSEELEDLRSSRAERLENLRFVRDRSGPNYELRPFAGLDLTDQNLDGLNIAGVNFTGATLTRASFILADLSTAYYGRDDEPLHQFAEQTSLVAVSACEANFTGAQLRGATMRKGNFRGADFRLAVLHGADLRGADLSEAKLEDQSFDLDWAFRSYGGPAFALPPSGAVYDDSTIWPAGFRPPANLAPSQDSQYSSLVEQTYRSELQRPAC